MRFVVGLIAALGVLTTSTLAPTPVNADDKLPSEVAGDEDAVRLSPISDWVVDFGDDYCRLVRQFGSSTNPHLLYIEQAAPSRVFTLTVAGSEFSRFRDRTAVALGLESDKPMREDVSFNIATLTGFGKALIMTSTLLGEPGPMPGILGLNLDAASRIDRIVLERPGKAVSFESGNMRAPLEVLNKCAQEFFEVWGLDPEVHRGHTSPKLKNAYEFARAVQEGYPRRALRKKNLEV